MMTDIESYTPGPSILHSMSNHQDRQTENMY
jgi:hypothetical protein